MKMKNKITDNIIKIIVLSKNLLFHQMVINNNLIILTKEHYSLSINSVLHLNRVRSLASFGSNKHNFVSVSSFRGSHGKRAFSTSPEKSYLQKFKDKIKKFKKTIVNVVKSKINYIIDLIFSNSYIVEIKNKFKPLLELIDKYRRWYREQWVKLDRFLETAEEKRERLDNELLANKIVIDKSDRTSSYGVSGTINANNEEYISKLKEEVKKDLDSVYKQMYSKTDEHEEYIKRKMLDDESIKAWDAQFEELDEQGNKKYSRELVVAKAFYTLQTQDTLERSRQTKVNPYTFTRIKEEVTEDDLTIESRIIPEDEEEFETLEREAIQIDDQTLYKANNAVTEGSPFAARFFDYFNHTNANIPEGYFFMNVDGADMQTPDNQDVVLKSIHAESIKSSNLSEVDQKLSIRTVGGVEISEHFDISMIKKTPANLGAIYSSSLDGYNVPNLSELKDEETVRLEMLVGDKTNIVTSQSGASARPLNKHVAFFRDIKPIDTSLLDEFIVKQTEAYENEANEPELYQTRFEKFLTWLGYPPVWREERRKLWYKYLEEREAYKNSLKLAEDGRENLTSSGEIPDMEPIPEEAKFQGITEGLSIDETLEYKPSYFTRRNSKYPGRYDNSWYDIAVIELLEPEYTPYEQFTYIIFELLERVYTVSLSEFESKPQDEYLKLEPTPITNWMDPSVAEMIQSNFALLPGHRMQSWASLFYGRWDDPAFTSDYQRCVDFYDDIVRMNYKKSYWWDDYSDTLKLTLLWFDVIAHTFFLIRAVVLFDLFSLLTYIYFCSISELTMWH